MNIRIYYESLEQVQFYIKPIIVKALYENNVNDYTITLIEKVQQSYTKSGALSKKYAKKISEILIQKNPDVIISIVKNDVEIPFILLEFSTAVFTKDHELQRTDNFNVALSSGAIYIKVSPIDKNSGAHGGDTSYQYLEPYSLFYKKFNELSFHINWNTDPNNESFVDKHPLYKSIPSQANELFSLINLALKTFIQNLYVDNWKEGFNDLVRVDQTFKNWFNSINNLTEFEDIKTINTTRMNWSNYNEAIQKNNVFTLKLNRLGHAMDPERGMLNYYGTFYKTRDNTFIAKLLFEPTNESWYKDTPKEDEISQLILNGFANKIDLVKAMVLGLSLPNYKSLKGIMEQSKDKLIDISKYINENILSFNTPFRNIIKNADILYITDGNSKHIYMTWDSDCYIEHSHDECPLITSITERECISEDDVTFITVHEFFKANGIQTFSVSYPGAQSDMPILPQPNGGRKQHRVYIDAIGIKDKNLLFQENKGPYSKSKINSDIEKIIKFKNDDEYKKAVVEFKRKNSLTTEKLFIGIGFGETSKNIAKINSELNIEEIDYFLVISKDMLSWSVFSSIDGDEKLFSRKRGQINKIQTFKVDNVER